MTGTGRALMFDATHELKRRSPLEGRLVSIEPHLRAAESPPMRRWSLRLPESAASSVSARLDFDIDAPLLSARRQGDVSALRLSPDEWLVLAAADASSVEERLLSLPAEEASVVDISHRQTGVLLGGDRSVEALAAFCPLDLHASVFPAGACTRTVFARMEITLWRLSETDFHIECWRSFSDYLWKGFEIAAADLKAELVM